MNELFYNIVGLNISLTPVIVAFLILAPLFTKQYSASFRYWLWLAITLRLLLPFSSGKYLPVLLNFPVHAGKTALSQNLPSGTINFPPAFAESAASFTLLANLTLGEIIIFTYFTGVLAFLVYKFVSYIIFCRSIRRWSKESPDPRIAAIISELSQIYGFNVAKNRLFA